MKAACPSCGQAGPLLSFAAEADARETVALALRCPANLGEPMLRYLTLFRPAKRALAWDRAKRLLGELVVDIERGQISRQNRLWVAPHAAWAYALTETLSRRETLRLPLKDHGYLYSIVQSWSSQGEAAQEAAEEAERQAAAMKRAGRKPRGETTDDSTGGPRRAIPAAAEELFAKNRKRRGATGTPRHDDSTGAQPDETTVGGHPHG